MRGRRVRSASILLYGSSVTAPLLALRGKKKNAFHVKQGSCFIKRSIQTMVRFAAKATSSRNLAGWCEIQSRARLYLTLVPGVVRFADVGDLFAKLWRAGVRYGG